MLLKYCTSKISHIESVRSRGTSSCMHLSLKVTVIGSFHCANIYLWFLRHETTLETYLGFISYNNLSLTVLSLMAATSLFPFSSFISLLFSGKYIQFCHVFHILFTVGNRTETSFRFSAGTFNAWTASQGHIVCFFLAITIFSSPLMQDLVSGYLGNYCGFTLWCS